MPYSTLYQEACNYLYVTNELTFRTLLTEFKDHKIMVMKKGGDGVDMLEIPLDVDALISLVEDMALWEGWRRRVGLICMNKNDRCGIIVYSFFVSVRRHHR